MASRTSMELDAGPSVATIFVDLRRGFLDVDMREIVP